MPAARTWAGIPVYSGAIRRTVQRLQGGRRHNLDRHVADRFRVVAAGDGEMERLIDRLDPPPEFTSLDRPERLGGLLAVGEAIGRPR